MYKKAKNLLKFLFEKKQGTRLLLFHFMYKLVSLYSVLKLRFNITFKNTKYFNQNFAECLKRKYQN